MAPCKKRFWFPIAGLGALFLAVVLAVNALLSAIYRAPAGLPESRSPSDYLQRKVKKARRVFDIMRGRRDESPRSEGRPSGPALSGVEGGAAFAFVAPEIHTAVFPTSMAGAVAPPVWETPARMELPAKRSISLLDEVLEEDVDPEVSDRLMKDWSLRSPAQDDLGALDDVFALPSCACDGVLDAVRGWFPSAGSYSMLQEGDRPLVEQLVQLQDIERERSPLRGFASRWLEREQRFLGGGNSDYLFTIEAAEGFAPIDQYAFMYEQRKILLDAVRKTYLMRYLGRLDERLRNDAWRVSEWKPLDFVAAPPILASYVWYHGWERRFSVLGAHLRVKVEPPSIILRRRDWDRDLVSAAGIECEIPGLPLSVIASTGLNDGAFGFDFLGVGTSLGEAKKAVVQLQYEEGETGR